MSFTVTILSTVQEAQEQNQAATNSTPDGAWTNPEHEATSSSTSMILLTISSLPQRTHATSHQLLKQQDSQTHRKSRLSCASSPRLTSTNSSTRSWPSCQAAHSPKRQSATNKIKRPSINVRRRRNNAQPAFIFKFITNYNHLVVIHFCLLLSSSELPLFNNF